MAAGPITIDIKIVAPLAWLSHPITYDRFAGIFDKDTLEKFNIKKCEIKDEKGKDINEAEFPREALTIIFDSKYFPKKDTPYFSSFWDKTLTNDDETLSLEGEYVIRHIDPKPYILKVTAGLQFDKNILLSAIQNNIKKRNLGASIQIAELVDKFNPKDSYIAKGVKKFFTKETGDSAWKQGSFKRQNSKAVKGIKQFFTKESGKAPPKEKQGKAPIFRVAAEVGRLLDGQYKQGAMRRGKALVSGSTQAQEAIAITQAAAKAATSGQKAAIKQTAIQRFGGFIKSIPALVSSLGISAATAAALLVLL
jgi:hypothetical protein